MTTYTIDDVRGIDMSITVEPSLQGYRAYGIAFNTDADIVGETESRQYISYCIADIVAGIAAELTAHVPHLSDQDIWDSIEYHGLTCHCA